MEITTHSVEHFVLSIYVIFLIVDLAVAYKNKMYYKIEHNMDKSYISLFYRDHKWTVLSFIACYILFSIFF